MKKKLFAVLRMDNCFVHNLDLLRATDEGALYEYWARGGTRGLPNIFDDDGEWIDPATVSAEEIKARIENQEDLDEDWTLIYEIDESDPLIFEVPDAP